MSRIDEAPTANRGTTAESARAERVKPLAKSEPAIAVDRIAVAGSTRHSVDKASALSAGSGRKINAHSSEQGKQKSLAAYHHALRCKKYAVAKKRISKVEMAEVYGTHDVEVVRKQLDDAEYALRQGRDQCDGISLEEISKDLSKASLQAGRRGDLGAQACYIARPSLGSIDAGEYHEDADQKKQYLTYAPRFMAHGIDVGYWPIVLSAVRILLDNGDLPPSLRSLPQPNPNRVYRAVRLTYYRSESGGPTDGIQDIMEMLEGRYHFSPQQIAQADRWAQQVYQDRFANSLPLDPGRSEDCN